MEPGPQQDSGDSEHPPMEGFGRETVMMPYYYGSVADGMSRGSRLEQRLKKTYWKTKQTVIQKLGKSQDEFVVAGDADIDSKLEKAYHLKSSCQDLLLALERYTLRTRGDEFIMGEYLMCVSESEYTNAGEVMQKVGKVEQKDSLARLEILSSLVRMQQEFATFKASAITDLDNSIRTLERARTEYRAALLWMKKVSEKLQDPDYRDQLAKFREAQAAVKETKSCFEKLKADLSEKIDMVSASRCNLFSRSLPAYQKQVLDYMDQSASEFHQVLADVRATHHHQYRVTKIMQEIRDLEMEEGEGLESQSAEQEVKEKEDDDDALIDVTMPSGGEGEGSAGGVREDTQGKDLDLLGLGAEIEELLDQPPSGDDELDNLLGLGLQRENATQPPTTAAREPKEATDQLFDAWNDFSAFMSTQNPESAAQDLDWHKELMSESLLDVEGVGGAAPSVLSQPQTKGMVPPAETGAGSAPPLIGQPASSRTVHENLLEPTAVPEENGGIASRAAAQAPSCQVDALLGLSTGPSPQASSSKLLDDILTLTMGEGLASSEKDGGGASIEPKETKATGTGIETLDPTLFQQQSTLPPSLPFVATTTTFPSPIPSQLPLAHGTTSFPPFRPPLTINQGSTLYPQAQSYPGGLMGGSRAGIAGGLPLTGPRAATKGEQQVGRSTKDKAGDKKENSWMNVFAHLDPLVNEKV